MSQREDLIKAVVAYGAAARREGVTLSATRSEADRAREASAEAVNALNRVLDLIFEVTE